ncbi:MAG: hypothetical protein ACYSTY_08320, partial [Planctomycetota bacterium]
MMIVRTSAVAAFVLAGGIFGGNVAVAGQQEEPSSEPAVVADELLTRAVHAERSYRERLARLERLRKLASDQGEADRVAELDDRIERSRVEHAGKVKRMRGRMSQEMLERFDAETAGDRPGRRRALGHQIAANAAAAGTVDPALQRELAGDLWQALAKRHARQYRRARIDNSLERWKQRAAIRREHRQDRREVRRERRQDRREVRQDRRQDRREAKFGRRQDRRDAKHERRQGRRDAKHER